MRGGVNPQRVLGLVRMYSVFFALIAFVITCCMMLFLNVMERTTGIHLTESQINHAAKLTFGNVVLLTLIFSAADIIRRRITIDRPVERITEAARQMTEGDFSVRIAPLKDDYRYGFNQIISCINLLAQELSERETLSGDLIANVSHELKTPLSIMQNYGTMLQQPGLDDGRRQEYTRAIISASRRMSDLITNILRLNKLENQQIFPAAREYNLSEQVCECLLGFEEAWEEKRLELDTDIQDGVLVRSDADMMALVWSNLFANAIKFTGAGGRISVSVGQEGRDAVVKVADTGCGISPGTGARIFDKFYQGDTSHATQGNGLGLSLVKRIMDITGNDISVESEPGVGSTFTVTIRPDGGTENRRRRA